MAHLPITDHGFIGVIGRVDGRLRGGTLLSGARRRKFDMSEREKSIHQRSCPLLFVLPRGFSLI